MNNHYRIIKALLVVIVLYLSEKILGHTPMNRFGVPADLDGTLLWLADDKFSAFVNGIVVPVDGGFAAYSGV